MRWVNAAASKRNTQTSLNTDLRRGSVDEYGSQVNYTQSSGEEKTSYIIGPYPNDVALRIYIGSGYQSTTNLSPTGTPTTPPSFEESNTSKSRSACNYYFVAFLLSCFVFIT